ncbi:unnamed protein product [Triticum turgidum subsp. durum]|uniref:Uncharacterized protein n=1 Tax=Triticum turgidum subsp. durum TaxID=4567 RepID=A0A9R0WTY1_TRITD|nr:unnamed protein product [Triticum turgidum subsp. durum]
MNTQPVDLFFSAEDVIDYFPPEDPLTHMTCEVLMCEKQALQTPFKSYLSDMLALVKKEAAERKALGALPLYERTLP